MPESTNAMMHKIGRLHIFLCGIPAIGESIARAYSWCMAFFPWLGGVRKTESIVETKQHLVEAGEQMGFPFQFSDIEGDRFILELPFCPYGFTESMHQRPCDTAMDMDRVMLRRCGAEMKITQTIPEGAECCRMEIVQKSAPVGS
ncbi:MAG: hypothetical protein CMQ20_08450 [Gammaproteobacteria bacterium]|jgi:hypothetical protein|nr:hypothetical protein [Gammaproteobacteria bacterium]|tara:strand:- start:1260 stop:1694 length:435 start_codon:yes stop_codon:yes gene_type:complete